MQNKRAKWFNAQLFCIILCAQKTKVNKKNDSIISFMKSLVDEAAYRMYHMRIENYQLSFLS